ncbi:MAG: arginine deiminase family protein [Anaerolineales bacterium]|nr:arginine deiminase family protein [Anaerolineales bacterium]
MKKTYTHAIVRPPGESYAQAISSAGHTPDVQLARLQHIKYCQALADAGVTLEHLPPDERYPDSCFVQDTALVIAGMVIIARPGANSRRGEEQSIAELLAERFPISHITAPGTLEFGDVMVLDDRILVGETQRTNADGIQQLKSILTPHNIPVSSIPVQDYLHLLSAATYLGNNTLLATGKFAEHPAFAGMQVINVPTEEAYAANALGVGRHVILPAGFPRVAEAVRSRDFQVLPVDLSQFELADGGATCLSIIWQS